MEVRRFRIYSFDNLNFTIFADPITRLNIFTINMLNRLLLCFLTCLPLGMFAQGLNGGFEVVHAGGIPAGWARTMDNGSSLTEDAFSGAKAAKAWVSEYYKSGGWISTSKPPSAAGLPIGLSGVYKYEGRKKECDPATVNIVATRRSTEGRIDTLAQGETELFLSKKYRTFSLDVQALSGAADAEFLSVRFEANGRCDWHIGERCCYLFADDLKFDEQFTLQVPIASEDSIDREPVATEIVTEPVFIQPVRKKRKKRSFILKPGKRKKPKKVKASKKASKPNRREKKDGIEVESAPIPTEIQQEIDRINAAQNDSTPDPAAIKNVTVPAIESPEQPAEEVIPDEIPAPEEAEEEFFEEEDGSDETNDWDGSFEESDGLDGDGDDEKEE
jgi:hypothetical protein